MMSVKSNSACQAKTNTIPANVDPFGLRQSLEACPKDVRRAGEVVYLCRAILFRARLQSNTKLIMTKLLSPPFNTPAPSSLYFGWLPIIKPGAQRA